MRMGSSEYQITKLDLFILTLFCAGLLLSAREAGNPSLAYFTFFPLGLLAVFHFFDRRGWLFLILCLGLLMVNFFLRGLGFVPHETGFLLVISASVVALLTYYRFAWQRIVLKEQELTEKVKNELAELQQKNSSRVESLLHLEKQVASLINLFEIAREFNECLDFAGTAQILYKKVLPELPFEKASLIILGARDKTPVISKNYMISGQGVEEKTEAGDNSAEKEWLSKSLVERAFLVLNQVWLFPLIMEGEFNALFAVQGPQKEDLAKFEVLTAQLTLQVRKIRLYEMVRELSIIDGLTGVFVRRHFLERFEEEIRRALKHKFPLSVLMLDIDHFKRYNDEFGHLVGDVTLREVAQVIRANVRNVDIVARYGGEEFAIVIPETRQDGALEVAERIRSAIARRAFRVYDEETKATISMGVAVFPQDITEANPNEYDPSLLFELLQKADRALYRAKEEGRNRVVLYSSLSTSH